MPNTYIEECINTRANVTVYTINGFQIKGCIIADEDSHIIVKSNGKKKMVYKHAISTVEPA